MTAVEWLELNLLGLISFDSEELRAKYKEIVAKAKEMEKQQQDEFAIGFAEWVECSKTYYTPMKELLQIYKKEIELL